MLCLDPEEVTKKKAGWRKNIKQKSNIMLGKKGEEKRT